MRDAVFLLNKLLNTLLKANPKTIHDKTPSLRMQQPNEGQDKTKWVTHRM